MPIVQFTCEIAHICIVAHGQILQMDDLVFIRGLPSLEGKHDFFVTKRGINGQPSLGQTDLIDQNNAENASTFTIFHLRFYFWKYRIEKRAMKKWFCPIHLSAIGACVARLVIG